MLSLLLAPLGPASEYWYLRDYWKRDTITGTGAGIEDVIFSFAIAGIPLALYPIVSRTRLTRRLQGSSNLPALSVLAGSVIISLAVGTGVFHINSIFTTALAFLITTGYIIYGRPDLIKPGIVSGGLTLILFVAIYKLLDLICPGVLELWCAGCNPTGLRIWGINAEELLWDLTWGILGGVLYQAVAGYEVQERNIWAANENRPSI